MAKRLGMAGGVLVITATMILAAGCGDKKAGMGNSASVAYESPSADYYAPGSLNSGTGSGSDGYASYDSGYGSSGGTTASYGGGQSHTVAKGDTLYSLARAYYNDQSKWKTIYEANRQTISDPNRLSVGQQLTIP